MFSFLNRRKETHESTNETPVVTKKMDQNADADDAARSEISSSVFDSSYNNQHPNKIEGTDRTAGSSGSAKSPTMRTSARNHNNFPTDPLTGFSAKRNGRKSPTNVHDISYVTQAPEHGYAAGYEDDLSTLGDESIIRRGRQNQKKQQQENQERKKKGQKKKAFDKTKIQVTNTNSTEEITPKSNDLEFSFENVMDANEKIYSTSKLGYEITDDSLTDKGRGRKMLDVMMCGGKGDPEKPEGSFVKRNKWTIIKFIIVFSLFLLMAASTVLIVSLLHMNKISNDTEASLIDNGGLVSDSTDNGIPSMSVPIELAPSPTLPLAPIFAATDLDVTAPTSPLNNVTEKTEAVTSAPFRESTESPTVSPSRVSTLSPLSPTIPPTETPVIEELESNDTDNVANTDTSSTEQVQIATDLKFVIANFSPTSLPYLEDAGSAQYKAYIWMTKDPNYWNMEISTIVQRWVLAVLYYSTDGPNWKTDELPKDFAGDKSPWLSYSDECLWESSNDSTQGLICDTENNYFAIHLRNLGLAGTIPSELGLLSDHMRLLFFNSNELTGSLPTELGNLKALEKINLQYNQLSGSLPTEIGELKALTIAAMGNNQLTGSIPTETGLWGSMQTIGFENNKFTGTLPSEWSKLPYIEDISLEENFLTGWIPYDWNFMYQLTSLSIQSNDLTGKIDWGLCPGCYSMIELKADCEEVKCKCCTECFVDSQRKTAPFSSSLRLGLFSNNP